MIAEVEAERCARCGLRALHRVVDCDEVTAMKTRIATLESALQPFATYAEGLPAIVPGHVRDTDETGVALLCSPGGVNYTIRFGDLRRARAALKALDER